MKPSIIALHHAIKAAILLGFAMYIVVLVKSDSILYYIAPRMIVFIKWSSVAFYAMAVYQGYRCVQAWNGHIDECDCGHDHNPSPSLFKSVLIYGLFFLPLLLGFLLPDAMMGTSIASKKGMNLSMASALKNEIAEHGIMPSFPSTAAASSEAEGPNAAAGIDAKFPANRYTEPFAQLAKQLYPLDRIHVTDELYIETLTAVDLYLNSFIGKKMELEGFVYREEGMKHDRFVLGRFAVQCCSADAAPYGVMVQYDEAKLLPTDAWVRVSGTIEKESNKGSEIMMLKLDSYQRISPPKAQYVYASEAFE